MYALFNVTFFLKKFKLKELACFEARVRGSLELLKHLNGLIRLNLCNIKQFEPKLK